MLDAILIIGVMAGAAFAVLWTQPETLRHLATRMWARAHAVEVGRQAYEDMVEKVENGHN